MGKTYTKSLKLKKLIEDLFEYTKLSNGIIQANKLTIDLIALLEQQMGEIYAESEANIIRVCLVLFIA